MNPTYIILWVVVIILLFIIVKYNGIIKLRNVRKQAFSDIDVQLKQRFNLIPNLVSTVKWYADHEKSTLDELTKARTSFLNAWDDVNWKSAAAPVMMAGAAGGDAGGEEQSSFNVELTSAGWSKIAVIKIIREITGQGLKEAKDLADNGGVIKEGADKAEAEDIKAKLEEAGATVELK